MKLDKIAAAEQLVDRVLKQAEEEEANIIDQLSKTEDELAEAVKARKKSIIGRQIMEASFNQVAAEKAIETLKEKLDDLAKRPLIAEAEYNKAANGVLKEFDDFTQETQKKLAGLSESMNQIANEFQDVQTRVNNILHRLQYDAYRNHDDEYVRDTEGRIMYTRKNVIDEETGMIRTVPDKPSVRRTDLRVDRSDIVNWGTRGVRCYAYKQVIGNADE